MNGDSDNPTAASMVDQYYHRITRLVEYYIFLCFILITFVPLLDYGWVPAAVRFIYFTGFPLLLLLLLVSLAKEPLLDLLRRRLEPSRGEGERRP